MIETYLVIMDEVGMTLAVMEADEPQVDAAVDHYLREGRDTAMHLTLLTGAPLRLRASRVAGWYVSTPDGRAMAEAGELPEDTREPWEG